ncbi:MAG: hypothetical protein BMS9Abin09_1080 [Gammaproteobacteria bacterium]|nr:MAG: hypothetical protein BMS9Abin09_1080 [Gammaproteobacteria bacterium]
MSRESSFPWSVRLYGLLALLGLATFISSLIVLHLMGTDIDWVRGYVSYLANKPLGWVFIAGTFVHGWGNLALTLGLRGALHPGRLRNWAVLLFGLAAVGILLTTLFPIEPPGQNPGMVGRAHRAIASATFALELAALFVFSAAFRRHRRWHRQQAVSLALSVSAAVALTAFFIAIQVDIAPGLTERVALAVLLAWELWISFQLIQPTQDIAALI